MSSVVKNWSKKIVIGRFLLYLFINQKQSYANPTRAIISWLDPANRPFGFESLPVGHNQKLIIYIFFMFRLDTNNIVSSIIFSLVLFLLINFERGRRVRGGKRHLKQRYYLMNFEKKIMYKSIFFVFFCLGEFDFYNRSVYSSAVLRHIFFLIFIL